MAFLVWVLVGGGAYLLWCAVTNKPPIRYAMAILSNSELPGPLSQASTSIAGTVAQAGGNVSKAIQK